MCLTIKKYRGLAKVAKSDIMVYKVLMIRLNPNTGELGYYSPYYNQFRWERGKEACSHLEVSRIKLDDGLWNTIMGYKRVYVDKGLHAFLTWEKADELARGLYHPGSRITLVRVMRIPKGAEYYKNDIEIVSNKMIML